MKQAIFNGFVDEEEVGPAPIVLDRSTLEQTAKPVNKKPPRPIRVVGDVAYIPLTKGLETVVDVADLPLVQDEVWTACDCGNGTSYAMRRCRRKLIQMHRVIMGAGEEDPRVDHRDRDSLNNRRSNLRFASSSQNNANSVRTKRLPGTSGFRGVWPIGKRWRASISVGHKSHYIGTFDSPEQAARAYDEQAIARFGEFATLNFTEKK